MDRGQNSEAAALLRTGCAAHDARCCELLIDDLGVDTAQVRTWLVEAYSAACHAGGAPCARLGGYLLERHQVDAAAAAFQRGCQTGAGDACYQLAWLVKSGKLSGDVAAPPGQLFRQGCRMGDAASCANWVLPAVVAGVAFTDEVRFALTSACSFAPASQACTELSRRLQGHDEASSADARAFLNAGCENGDQEACEQMRTLEPPRTKKPWRDPVRVCKTARACEDKPASRCKQLSGTN